VNESNNLRATRRGFVTTAALTAVSYNRVLGAKDRIGLGFIGFGLIGKQHVADFKKFADGNLVALSETYRPRLQQGLEYRGIRTPGATATFAGCMMTRTSMP